MHRLLGNVFCAGARGMGRRFGSKVKSRNVVSLAVPKLLSIYYRAVNVFSTECSQEFLHGMGFLLTIPQLVVFLYENNS